MTKALTLMNLFYTERCSALTALTKDLSSVSAVSNMAWSCKPRDEEGLKKRRT